MSRALSLALVALVLTSGFAPALAGVASASADAPPSGMVGVADSNIDDIRPESVRSNANVSESEFEGAVFVSEYASTTEVSLVTEKQSAEVARGASPSSVAFENAPSAAKANSPAFSSTSDVGFALVISDDENHDGRRVAVDVDVVEEALGYVPERLAVRNNETGETWTSSARVVDGYLVADIEHFSSNSVEFSGEVNLGASGATNGTTLSYNLSSTDGASDPVVNFTGTTNTEWDNISASGVSPSGSVSLSIGGNVHPTGPSTNNRPTVTISADKAPYSVLRDEGWSADGTRVFVGDDTFDNPQKTEFRVEPSNSVTVDALQVNVSGTTGSDLGTTHDVYIVQEKPDGTKGEGTKVASWDADWSTGWQTIQLSSSYTFDGGKSYTIEIVSSSDGDGTEDKLSIHTSSTPSTVWMDNGASRKEAADLRLGTPSSASGLTVSDGDGNSASFGDINAGEAVTRELNFTPSSSQLNLSANSGSGTLQVSADLRERTQTTDPAVEINGEWVNHTGALKDDETVSISGNSSSLKNGTNRLNITLDESLSSDAPPMRVDMHYSHDAKVSQSVDYSSEALTARYNVTRQFETGLNSAQMRIAFSEKAYSMRDIETRENGGSWKAVDSSNYRITDANELVVELGTVSENDTVSVRANASRVQTHNLSITVLEPSTTSELDSKVRIDSIGENAHITVSSGDGVEFLRYASKESWSDENVNSRVFADGEQRMFFPNAGSGDTFRLKSHETKIWPETNEVDVRVEDSGQEPTIRLGPGPTEGDTVKIKYYNTVSGEKYVLWSESRDVQVDSDTAESPVLFETGDSPETLSIFEDSSNTTSSGSSSDSSSGGSVVQGAKEATSSVPPIVVVGAALGVTVALFWVSSRAPGERAYFLYVTIPPTWLFAGELAGIPVISYPIQVLADGVGEVVPFLALLAGGFLVYLGYVRFIKDAAKPDKVTNVEFDVGEGGGSS